MIHQHTGGATEDVDVAHCTQPPSTTAKSGLKRLRKEQQQKAFAAVGETTPKPRCSGRLKKATTTECGLADLSPMLQTPMPESDVPNAFGPPPPDSTPARQRGESCIYMHYTIYLLGIHWVCLNTSCLNYLTPEL